MGETFRAGGEVERLLREAGQSVTDRPGAMRAFYADAERGREAVAADVESGWLVDDHGAAAAALLLAFYAGWRRGAEQGKGKPCES